jgi:putative component of membrane protein insertase Oxa1/YidC/SpoIIIJ protein YidD
MKIIIDYYMTVALLMKVNNICKCVSFLVSGYDRNVSTISTKMIALVFSHGAVFEDITGMSLLT